MGDVSISLLKDRRWRTQIPVTNPVILRKQKICKRAKPKAKSTLKRHMLNIISNIINNTVSIRDTTNKLTPSKVTGNTANMDSSKDIMHTVRVLEFYDVIELRNNFSEFFYYDRKKLSINSALIVK